MKKIILIFYILFVFSTPVFAVEISSFGNQSLPFGYTSGTPIDNFASAKFANSNKVVVVYSDTGQKYGAAVVGDININNTVDWGAASIFTSVNTAGNLCKVTTIGTDTIVVMYYNEVTTYTLVRAGTIDESNNITWATPNNLGTFTPTSYSLLTMDSNKFIAGVTGPSKPATVTVGICNANKTITWNGSADIIAANSYMSLTKLTDTKFARLLLYPSYNIVTTYNIIEQGGPYYNITSGVVSAFDSSSTLYYPSIVSLSSTKIAISFQDSTDGNKGKCKHAILDGSDNMSWSDTKTFTTNNAALINSIPVDSSNFIINYSDNSTSAYGKSVVVNENNNVLTPADIKTYINSDVSFSSSSLLLSSDKFINFYSCSSSSYNGVAKVGFLTYPTQGYKNKLNGITIQYINNIIPAKINGI